MLLQAKLKYQQNIFRQLKQGDDVANVQRQCLPETYAYFRKKI